MIQGCLGSTHSGGVSDRQGGPQSLQPHVPHQCVPLVTA